jgi:hypothetical protein
LNGTVVVNGVSIDWGNFVWHTKDTDPVNGQFPTQHLSFNAPGQTNGSFTFTQPRVLVGLDINNRTTTSSTVTLTCAPNTAKTYTIPATTIVKVTTSWTQACSTVNIATSNDWNTRFDNIIVSGGSAVTPTNSPTPTTAVIPGDVDRNGLVNILDYTILFEAYGTQTGDAKFDARADFVGAANGGPDGKVNILDYTVLFENF